MWASMTHPLAPAALQGGVGGAVDALAEKRHLVFLHKDEFHAAVDLAWDPDPAEQNLTEHRTHWLPCGCLLGGWTYRHAKHLGG